VLADAGRRQAAAALRSGSSALTLPTRLASFDLLVRSTPPSTGVTSTVFALARPEYFHELRPVGLLGSMVNSAPRLPITFVRPDCLALRMWHEVSRTTPQIRSGDALAMVCKGRGGGERGVGQRGRASPEAVLQRAESTQPAACRQARLADLGRQSRRGSV
jgi:hypothetical protein